MHRTSTDEDLRFARPTYACLRQRYARVIPKNAHIGAPNPARDTDRPPRCLAYTPLAVGQSRLSTAYPVISKSVILALSLFTNADPAPFRYAK